MAAKGRRTTGAVPRRYKEDTEDELVGVTMRSSLEDRPLLRGGEKKTAYQKFLEAEEFDDRTMAELWARASKQAYYNSPVPYDRVVQFEQQQQETDDPVAIAEINALYPPLETNVAAPERKIVAQWTLAGGEAGKNVSHIDLPINYNIYGHAGIVHSVVVSASTTYPDSYLAVRHVTVPKHRDGAEATPRPGFMNVPVSIMTSPPSLDPIDEAIVVFGKDAPVVEHEVKAPFGPNVHPQIRPALQSVIALTELKQNDVEVRIRGFTLENQHGIIQCLVKFQHRIYPVMGIDFVFLFATIREIWGECQDFIAGEKVTERLPSQLLEMIRSIIDVCGQEPSGTPVTNEDAKFIVRLLGSWNVDCVVTTVNYEWLKGAMDAVSQTILDTAKAYGVLGLLAERACVVHTDRRSPVVLTLSPPAATSRTRSASTRTRVKTTRPWRTGSPTGTTRTTCRCPSTSTRAASRSCSRR